MIIKFKEIIFSINIITFCTYKINKMRQFQKQATFLRNQSFFQVRKISNINRFLKIKVPAALTPQVMHRPIMVDKHQNYKSRDPGYSLIPPFHSVWPGVSHRNLSELHKFYFPWARHHIYPASFTVILKSNMIVMYKN